MACAGFNTSVNGSVLTLTNTTSPVGAGYPNYNRYVFGFGDGTSEVVDYPSLNPSPHTYANAGNYTVSLTTYSQSGGQTLIYCGISKTVSIGGAAANVAPTAHFTAAYIKTYSDGTQLWGFDASASVDPDGYINQYSWSWGDGTNYSGQAAGLNHVYKPGTYTVVLTVYDNNNKPSNGASTVITVGRSV